VIQTAVRTEGPIAFEKLLARLPDEAWESDAARAEGLSNALTRLRLKKIIRLDVKSGGWCWGAA
jgi:hypothetical protein